MCRGDQWKCTSMRTPDPAAQRVLDIHMKPRLWTLNERRCALAGGLLLVAVIKMIIDRNWIGLLLCAVALLLQSLGLDTTQNRPF